MNQTFESFKNKAYENLKSLAYNMSVKDVALLHNTSERLIVAKLKKGIRQERLNNRHLSEPLAAQIALDRIAKQEKYYSLSESKRHKEMTINEDSLSQNMRFAVSQMQELSSEDDAKARKLITVALNNVFDTNELEPALEYINNVQYKSAKEYFADKLRVAVSSRILQMAGLLINKNKYNALEAMEEIVTTERIILKLAEVASQDFFAEVKLEEARREPKQTGNKICNLMEKIDDALLFYQFPNPTFDFKQALTAKIRDKIENPHRGLGIVATFDMGEIIYENLTAEQLDEIEDIILDIASDMIGDTEQRGRQGTPRKYAKFRGGFPGTAKKTK